MKKYSELLKSPKWQRKRLEILSRDNFACRGCGDQENTLHVHHCYYKKSALPWEYEDSSLITLCVDCHSIETELLNIRKYELLDALSRKGMLSEKYSLLTDFIDKSHDLFFEKDESFYALLCLLVNKKFAQITIDKYLEVKSKHEKTKK